MVLRRFTLKIAGLLDSKLQASSSEAGVPRDCDSARLFGHDFKCARSSEPLSRSNTTISTHQAKRYRIPEI